MQYSYRRLIKTTQRISSSTMASSHSNGGHTGSDSSHSEEIVVGATNQVINFPPSGQDHIVALETLARAATTGSTFTVNMITNVHNENVHNVQAGGIGTNVTHNNLASSERLLGNGNGNNNTSTGNNDRVEAQLNTFNTNLTKLTTEIHQQHDQLTTEIDKWGEKLDQ
jgi:hypothetical protein